MTVAYTAYGEPCDRCRRDAYTQIDGQPRHPCCHHWWDNGWLPDRIGKGRDCPACLESDEHARKEARRRR